MPPTNSASCFRLRPLARCAARTSRSTSRLCHPHLEVRLPGSRRRLRAACVQSELPCTGFCARTVRAMVAMTSNAELAAHLAFPTSRRRIQSVWSQRGVANRSAHQLRRALGSMLFSWRQVPPSARGCPCNGPRNGMRATDLRQMHEPDRRLGDVLAPFRVSCAYARVDSSRECASA